MAIVIYHKETKKVLAIDSQYDENTCSTVYVENEPENIENLYVKNIKTETRQTESGENEEYQTCEFEELNAPDTRTREQKIADEINAKYDINEQIAILRQKDTKPEKFKVFDAYCESVKAKY